jgi:golgin subfamily B member 1
LTFKFKNSHRDVNEQIELLKNTKLEKEAIKKIKEDLANLEFDRDKKQMCLENAEDKLGLDGRERGARAVLIICENKNDVRDIVKAMLVRHKHIFDYNGKVDGIRQIMDAYNKKISAKVKQVRPGDIIVATNVAGRGTDFKISEVISNFISYFWY